MLVMHVPILGILRRQCFVPDDRQVLGILLLGGLGEIEAPVMTVALSMTIILLREMAWLASIIIGKEIRRRVPVGAIALSSTLAFLSGLGVHRALRRRHGQSPYAARARAYSLVAWSDRLALLWWGNQPRFFSGTAPTRHPSGNGHRRMAMPEDRVQRCRGLRERQIAHDDRGISSP